MIELSVVIVTYNSGRSITDCLKSIAKNIKVPLEIVVVDNNSTDDTVKKINDCGVRVKLIELDENKGFSKGNNIGAEATLGKLLFFLNPDTKITKFDFGEVESLLKKPENGMVAPKLVLPSGQTQKSVTHLPTIKNAFLEYWLGVKNIYKEYAPDTNLPVEVEAVYGAALILRKDLFTKIGKFNEKYFLYFEDLDLCRALKDSGYKIIYLPSVVIEHEVGASGKTNPRTQSLFLQSAKSYHGAFNYFIINSILRFRILDR